MPAEYWHCNVCDTRYIFKQTALVCEKGHLTKSKVKIRQVYYDGPRDRSFYSEIPFDVEEALPDVLSVSFDRGRPNDDYCSYNYRRVKDVPK